MSLIPTHVRAADDQLALMEAARDFARERLLPLDRACDQDESSLGRFLPMLGEMGLLSLCIPQDLGGLGCPYTTYAAILHELAVHSPSACVMVAVHSLVGRIVLRRAADPLRSEWLSRWGDPSSFSAFAMSEAGAGSDARSIATTAVKTSGGYRVTGEKMWITNGLSARWLLTLARLDGAPPRDGFCALMVDAKQPGVERAPIHGKMGIRGSDTAVIHFSDVFVPRKHVIGEPGDGMAVFLTSLNHGRVGIAAQATGIAEACVTEMVSYARQREQFGQAIGRFQGVAEMIADSAVELEAAKALVWRAANRIEQGQTPRAVSSMAKAYAAEAANRIAYRAVQVHGGAGFVQECRVEQLYRDARVTSIYEGTTQIQRIVIAREMERL